MPWRCGAFEFEVGAPQIRHPEQRSPQASASSKDPLQNASRSDAPSSTPAGMRPLIMGILNVTPDSFSDGGTHNKPLEALAHAEKLLAEGAQIIDVGGESTRPGSVTPSVEEELTRVLPVVRELAARGVCVSVDTRHAPVAAACLEAGAAIINDVAGMRDAAMREVVAASSCGVVIMHMQGEPGTMQDFPHYDDVVAEVTEYLLNAAHKLEALGVAPERICLDPGIGFGKTVEHNRALLEATPQLAALGYPLMVAVSRKAYIGACIACAAKDGVSADTDTADEGSLTTASGKARPRPVRDDGASQIRHPEQREGEAFGASSKDPSKNASRSGAPFCLSADLTSRDRASALCAAAACRDGAFVARVHNADTTKRAFEHSRQAVVALGSNIGDGPATVEGAVATLRRVPGVWVTRVSRSYTSEPAYYADQDMFTNAVALVQTSLGPHELLDALHNVENEFGRVRSIVNGPRTLDLDIVDYDGVVSHNPALTLPHPRALERDFVVTPLLEVAPGYVLANGTPVTRDAVNVGRVTAK